MSLRVAVHEDPGLRYPSVPPFDPSTRHPELEAAGVRWASRPNAVYDAVRATLASLGLDAARLGTADWNPLGDLIPRGGRVLLKPNWALHKSLHCHDEAMVVTHGSVIRALLDYAWLACGPAGEVVVGDTSLSVADLERIWSATGMQSIAAVYRERGLELPLEDYRVSRAVYSYTGVVARWEEVPQAPGACVDLRLEDSAHGEPRSYTLPRRLLAADAVLNVPKLKTHKIAGLTCCLKAMIGACMRKEQILPHYRPGAGTAGGDERRRDGLGIRLKRAALRGLKRGPRPLLDAAMVAWAGFRELSLRTRRGRALYGSLLEHGAWPGNDTLWRTILDLNRLVHYGTAAGEVADTPQRTVFSLVDGIVAGEGHGPFQPAPRAVGVLVAGESSLANDVVCARLMGYDWRRIRTLDRSAGAGVFPGVGPEFPRDLELRTSGSDPARADRLRAMFRHGDPLLDFVPPAGWDELRGSARAPLGAPA